MAARGVDAPPAGLQELGTVMKRIDRVAPQAMARRLRAAGWMLSLCAGLTLTACGGGGGGGGSDPTPTPPVTPPAIVAPSIGTQPLDAKVNDGATTTFSVSASGSSLSYQWQRDGKAITGATGASYTTPVLHMADNGAKYVVVVSGPNASVTSSVVTLTVSPIALNLTAQPQAQTAKDGDVVSFDVSATGSEPIQYQWHRNGVVIAGADKATYTTAVLALADNAAVFKVVVTNPAGTVNSQEAKLTVTAVAPRIVTAPESVTTSDGASVTFKVTAAGSAPLAYQWLRNGNTILGATEASYITTLALASSGDRFTVRVGNGAGYALSEAAVATVNAAAPAITLHPSDASLLFNGEGVTFRVAATGTPPLRYQWQQSQDEGLSWSGIPGATSPSYSIGSVTLADTHTRLRAAVSNAAATLNSNAARLEVTPLVRLLAGNTGGSGYADGKGNLARFNWAGGISADPSGNVYVIDNNNSVIRRVSPDGTVKLFGGQAKNPSRVDGPLVDARFYYPQQIAVDRAGTVYVAEYCNIRRIAAGVVSGFLGTDGCNTRDGALSQASVSGVMGMAVDADGTLYFSERNNSNGQLVRKITSAGVVSTLAGSPTESGKTDGTGSAARFSNIGKLAVDANKNVFVADGTAIRQISPSGEVSYYAGAPDSYGQTEGYRTSARLGYITGLAFDGRGNLFVADNQRIARISTIGNVVTAVGSGNSNDGYPTSVDGPGATASAGNPTVLASLPNGGLAFFDNSAYAVRTLTVDATVTTLAGGGRSGGFADGVGTAARFASYAGHPSALILAPNGTLTLADTTNRRIRRFSLDSRLLDTLAGTSNYGGDDGPASLATFAHPIGLAYDAAGNLYVSDGGQIRRISASGTVTTIAGRTWDWGCVDGVGAAARFSAPAGMVVDSKGNLIVAEQGYYVLRRVTPDGTVTTIAGKSGESGYVNGVGSDARLGAVRYLAIDKADNVYFTDGYQSIRKLAPNGEVSTAAGAPYSSALIDDIGAFARFNNPSGLAFDARGNLYVADTGNNAIRRITPSGQVSTVIASNSLVSVLQPGPGGNINQPTAITVTPAGRLVFLSEGAIVGD